METVTLWRQKATITAALLVNLMGVYSLYTLHRSGFFVIPESEAVTASDTISANSSCTAVNDVITPTSYTFDVTPAIASDGSTSSSTTLFQNNGVDGDTAPHSLVGTASWTSDATKLVYNVMFNGPAMVHAAGCNNITDILPTSNATFSVDSSSTPFVLTSGTHSDTLGTMATIIVPGIDLYSGVATAIGAVDPQTKSFVKYGTNGDTGVDVPYKIGMKRTVSISSTNAAQSRTITFTSNVNGS